MRSVDPTSGELIREYPDSTLQQVDNALVAARDTFGIWSELGVAERGEHLLRLAEQLRARKAELATLMTLEMGKPITQAEAEVDKCAWVCEHFAREAGRYLDTETVATDASWSGIRYDPLGIIFAIMPWNFPLWQVFRCAVPALAAGNVVVLKHAENVTGCALAIAELFVRAAFPHGVFSSLVLPREAAERIIAHPAVAAIALTGSVRAGREVAALAGRHLKKCVLELGGSDPFIVLADADLGQAVEAAVKSRTQNTGQSCIAAKRFILEAPIADRFEDAFVARIEQLRIGSPMQRETELGPLARLDLLEALHEQVLEGIEQGARLSCGGDRLERAGFFYRPTVLTRVTPGMRVFEEETFGPVAAMVRADSARHAISLANQSRFGLGASLWTRDLDLARELARRLHAGSVFVNSMVASDPRLPFGGVKESGLGRELGAHGIRELTNVKSVSIA
jgi:acyl-CoA reductase-like NAD-dependent aldehyde dehydrogenase